MDGYYVPTNEWKFERPKTFWAKQRKENIIEKEARMKKDNPGPCTYKLNMDWTKNTQGKFLKGKKSTMIDDILAQKKLKLPGPGTYEIKGHRIQQFAKVSSEKCEFINNAKFIGLQTPGWKYKINYVRNKIKLPGLCQCQSSSSQISQENKG